MGRKPYSSLDRQQSRSKLICVLALMLQLLALEADADATIDVNAELRTAGIANLVCGGAGGCCASQSSAYVGALRRAADAGDEAIDDQHRRIVDRHWHQRSGRSHSFSAKLLGRHRGSSESATEEPAEDAAVEEGRQRPTVAHPIAWCSGQPGRPGWSLGRSLGRSQSSTVRQ